MTLTPSKLERRHLVTAATIFGAIAVAALVLLFPLLAHGQEPGAPSADDLGALLALGAKALAAGGAIRWIGLSLLGVLAAVWIVRRIAKGRTSKWARWVLSDEGGTVLGWVASAGGALAVHVVGGGRLSAGELGAVALGLRAGTSVTWSDSRRIVRALTPLVKLIPWGIGEKVGAVLDLVSGANAKAEIAKATADAYKSLSPAPDVQAAADLLSRPPVP